MLGFVVITSLMVIYWFTNFKIHIYERIIEEYHYNRVQEIPLAIISSDYENEHFVEKVNKAFYGFYSEQQIDNFEDQVKEKTIEQVGEAYWWTLSTGDLYFGRNPLEGCKVKVRWIYPTLPNEEEKKECYCSSECEVKKSVEIGYYESCSKKLPLAECLGSLAINITFFNETFPFPLVFNGSQFTTEMRFNAYA